MLVWQTLLRVYESYSKITRGNDPSVQKIPQNPYKTLMVHLLSPQIHLTKDQLAVVSIRRIIRTFDLPYRILKKQR